MLTATWSGAGLAMAQRARSGPLAALRKWGENEKSLEGFKVAREIKSIQRFHLQKSESEIQVSTVSFRVTPQGFNFDSTDYPSAASMTQ
mmetsp:Transcript_27981/g.86725  ORF Transcript_27981/g.86725 Transcript_27981/m.86725 type:complete len:89 (-) Transcript_27981:18-284(-)